MKSEIKETLTQADSQLLFEIFAFEGSEPLSEKLVIELIQRGWPQSIFEELQKTDLVLRCEHGGRLVYYNRKRDSLLFPIQNELTTTVEIERNLTKHLHSLPPGFVKFVQ
jgi:hypothetical protein